jgi:Fe2+ or Zn2+ uptake regulation protein
MPPPTVERLRVVREVFEGNSPFTANDLYESLVIANQRISRSTVFRTITMLVAVELLKEWDLGKFVYEFNQ